MQIYTEYLKLLPESFIKQKSIGFIDELISPYTATALSSAGVEKGALFTKGHMLVVYASDRRNGCGLSGVLEVPSKLNQNDRERLVQYCRDGIKTPIHLCHVLNLSESDEDHIANCLTFITIWLRDHEEGMAKKICSLSKEGKATCLLITDRVLTLIPLGGFLLVEKQNES